MRGCGRVAERIPACRWNTSRLEVGEVAARIKQRSLMKEGGNDTELDHNGLLQRYC